MTVVQGTALDSAGAPIKYARVVVTLQTGSLLTPGYGPDGELIGPHIGHADDTGAWSIDLTPNTQITPGNTTYLVVEGIGASVISVPDSGGPYTLAELLVTDPPTPDAPGITGVQVAAGGTVAGSRPEINVTGGANIAVTATDNPGANRVDVQVGFTGTVGPSPAVTVTDGTSYGQSPAVGVGTEFSRDDHRHGTPAAPPTGTTSVAGLLALDGTAADLQPHGVADPGDSGLAADGKHAHPLPAWIFPITKYGAVGDLQCTVDGQVTSASPTLTCPSGPFRPQHSGMTFVVKGALANGNCLVATGTYVSATQMTLSVNATTTASSLQVLWGTDDTAAIQQAIDAAMDYSSPFGLAAEVFTPPTGNGYGYLIAGALKSTDGTNAIYNSQLTIKPHSDRAAKKRLALTGVGDAGDCRHWNQDLPAFGGSTWFSACLPFATLAQQQTGPNGVSTLGNPSVIGSGTGKAGYGVTGANPNFSNITVSMRDMTILTAHSVNGWTISPFNFHGVAGAHLDRCSFGTNGVVQYYLGAGGSGGNTDFAAVNSLSGGISIGGLLPAAGNNASNRIRDCVWNGGYTYGPLFTEHTTGGGNTILYCWSGFCPAGNYGDGGSGAGALHGIELGQICVEGCAYQVNVFGAAAASKGPYVDVILDTEGSRQLRDNPSNGTGLAALRGVIRFRGSSGVPALTFPTACQILLEENAPGAPGTAPTLIINTAKPNTTGRWATLYLSGGVAITTVQVSDLMWGATAPAVTTRLDFTGTGTIPAGTSVRVGPGQWVQINGTNLPTATWVLE